MHLPDTGWTRNSWNGKREQFNLLGRMIGLSSRPSSEELQEALKRVASAKVFAESVQDFIEATGKERGDVANELEHINKKLGAMEPIPFRSICKGQVDPSSFRGIAIWPAGTVSWMQLRWDQIKLAEQAGARIQRIFVFGSSRICNAEADRRHPYIREVFPEGREPTERELMRQWVHAAGPLNSKYTFVDLPERNEHGRPLSLEEQLRHMKSAWKMGDELYWQEMDIFVPANPNALYVPLHVRRVLGKQDVYFCQSGARIQREMPAWWWPSVQDLWTTPSGILRLWIELRHAGCITD